MLRSILGIVTDVVGVVETFLITYQHELET